MCPSKHDAKSSNLAIRATACKNAASSHVYALNLPIRVPEDPIYLSELDKFLEDTLKANPAKESKTKENARRTKEGRAIENRITRLRRRMRANKDSFSKEQRDSILTELQELEQRRKNIPQLHTRQRIGFIRYADDYLLILQRHSKAEAERVKEQVGNFLKTHLRLEQSEEKTFISHPTDPIAFLGYELVSAGGRRKALRLNIPKQAVAEVLSEVKRMCRLHHMPEADLFYKVNAILRGWMSYYRHASAPQRTFSAVLRKVFWLVSHYLARKHTTSIPTILRRYGHAVSEKGRARKTLRKWIKGTAIDLWMFPPQTANIYEVGRGKPADDAKAIITHEWATGRSIESRIESLEEANYQCQKCGSTVHVEVHHIGGLRGYRGIKNRCTAGRDKQKVALCRTCHREVGHHGSFAPRNRGNRAA